MAKILFLMCGPAGAGKSTWINNFIDSSIQRCKIVSRDEIRFKMVQEDEEYFSKETEVFARFGAEIREAVLDDSCDIVFADATHLTEKSRNKTLDFIKDICHTVDIIPVSICPAIETVLQQNDRRSGRQHVPAETVTNMYNQYKFPTHNEKYIYTTIIKEE